MFECLKTLITMKMCQFLSFYEVFSSWKGGGVVVKLAKVICQHMFFCFFFTLSYFLDNNLGNEKRYDNFSP